MNNWKEYFLEDILPLWIWMLSITALLFLHRNNIRVRKKYYSLNKWYIFEGLLLTMYVPAASNKSNLILKICFSEDGFYMFDLKG